MIDPQTEQVVLATKLDFHRDRPTSTQTVTRWILKGMKAVDGRYVQLEALRIGAQWYSSQAAVERLIQAVNTPANTIPAMSPQARESQNEAAKRVLEAAGI